MKFKGLTDKYCVTGYLIPKGWKVMPLFRNIHHDPKFFPDPQKFDPSRFEVRVTQIQVWYVFTAKYIFISMNWFVHIYVVCFVGCAKTKYICAIWQWSTRLPRKRACQAGDAYYDPPPSDQVQVLFKSCLITVLKSNVCHTKGKHTSNRICTLFSNMVPSTASSALQH